MKATYLFNRSRFFLLEHREDPGLKVRDIVKQCNVSASGVIRFCQHLGFSGFAELKYQMRHEWEEEEERARNNEAIRKSSDQHLGLIHRAFQNTHAHLDSEKMNELVALLHDADEIVVIGLGSSWIVAKDFELRFQRLKKNCRALNDVNLQYFAARNASEKSVFIGISYSGITEVILDTLKVAGAEKAKTVLMTHYSNRHLKAQFDYMIYVYGEEGKNRRTSTISRLTMLYLVDMIYFMYMNHYMEEVSDCLEYNTKT